MNNSRLNFFIGNILHKIEKQVVLVTYDKAQLNQIHEDLLRLLPDDDILIFPEIEVLPHEQIDPDIMVMKERLEVLEDVLYKQEGEIVLTTSRALSYKLMPVSLFMEYSLNLEPGDEINLSYLSKKLEMIGYERVDMVEQPLQFSLRGGIIDIFTLSNEHPYRLELFGDEIDSIRVFDQATQRSCENLEQVVIPPAREIIINSRILGDSLGKIEADFKQGIQRLQTMGKQEEGEYLSEKRNKLLEQLRQFQFFPGYEQFLPYYYEQPGNFFEYIPLESRIFYDHPERVWQRLHGFHRDLQENQATLLEQGSVLPSYSRNFLEPKDFIGASKPFISAYFGDQFKDVPIIRAQREISFKTRGVEPYHGQLELFVERVSNLIEKNYRVLITLNSESKADRIGRFLEDRGLTVTRERDRLGRGRVVVISGSFAEGFILEDVKLAVFTENEVIGKRQKKKREISDFEEGVKISSLNELETGDYVVHENHGIGKYLGVKTLEIQNRHQDYLVIKYAGEDKLYVPTEKVHLVQKYIGADSTPPRLYKLGGNEWQKVKQRVQDSVKEMAIGLLELYAEREATKGYAFSEDSEWQREFDDDFPYEETPDQMAAIRDVKRDMESPQPMDRLLCGDVGYGKTEVAIRAAFKAAVDGKQTAVLVPTTILAQQHYNTFKERINKYPITV
ncbi:MAG: CarD family transcriptional regulator, partial [Bacillota bacterium]